MFPLLKNCIENWLIPRSSYLLAFIGVLFMINQIGQVGSVDDISMNKTCSPCLTPNCAGQGNCLQQCMNACPPNYYQIAQNISFVCETSQQTSVPTTKMTTAEKTTQSTTMPTTTVIPTTTDSPATPMPPTTPPPTFPTGGHSISAADPHAPQTQVKRRRRQAPPESSTAVTQNEQTTLPPVTSVPSTINEPTTTQPPIVITTQSSTTTISKIICKKCTIANCKSCSDGAHQNAVCSACADGYSLSSDKNNCDKESEGLSGGAIAGIVIGVLCAVTIVVVVIVYLVVRRRSHNISSDHTEKIQHQRKTSEELEIDQLDDAPAPPAEYQGQRYDKLQASKVDEGTSYSPFGSVSESPYVNQPRKHQIPGSYVNTQNNIDSAKNSPTKPEDIYNNDPKNNSPDPAGYYEPVNPQRQIALNSDLIHENLGFVDDYTKSNTSDTQGVYANMESIKASQGNTNKNV